MAIITAVAHTKGGVGKSTLVWNLAHSLVELGKKVIVIDLDFQQTLYFVNQIREKQQLDVIQFESVKELMHELLHKQDDEPDYYIIDIGGFDNDINRTAIDMSHKVLIPVSNSVTEVIGYKTFEGILNELILKDTEFSFVLNNIHPLAKNFDEIKEALGDEFKVLDTVLHTRKEYRASMGNGLSVLETNDAKAKEEVRSLRDEWLGLSR